MLSPTSPTSLNHKDTIIQNLQQELTQASNTMQQFVSRQHARQVLLQNIEQLQHQLAVHKHENEASITVLTKNTQDLKTSLETMRKELRTRTVELQDLQADRDGLTFTLSTKESQVHDLEGDIDRLQEKLDDLHGDRLKLEAQKKKYEKDLSELQIQIIEAEKNKQQLEANKDVYDKRIHQASTHIKTKTDMLSKYEKENNALDREIQSCAALEADVDKRCKNVFEQIGNYELTINEMESNILKEVAVQEQMTRAMQAERIKTDDLLKAIANRERQLRNLQTKCQQEQDQSNYILHKNQEIVKINQRLKEDLTQTKKHVDNVMRMNQRLSEKLKEFREEDQNIAERIRDRKSRDNKMGLLVRSASLKKLHLSDSRATGLY